nr:MAG TPA: hypothetical protein [Inoviridae sp.]
MCVVQFNHVVTMSVVTAFNMPLSDWAYMSRNIYK